MPIDNAYIFAPRYFYIFVLTYLYYILTTHSYLQGDRLHALGPGRRAPLRAVGPLPRQPGHGGRPRHRGLGAGKQILIHLGTIHKGRLNQGRGLGLK